MEAKKRMFWVAVLAGAIGAGFGSAAGSNSVLINMAVGIVISLLAAWGISGVLR